MFQLFLVSNLTLVLACASQFRDLGEIERESRVTKTRGAKIPKNSRFEDDLGIGKLYYARTDPGTKSH